MYCDRFRPFMAKNPKTARLVTFAKNLVDYPSPRRSRAIEHSWFRAHRNTRFDRSRHRGMTQKMILSNIKDFRTSHDDYLLKTYFDFETLNATVTEKVVFICNRLCSLLVIGCYRFVQVGYADLNASRFRPKGSCSGEICLNILRVHDIRFTRSKFHHN